jgi:hypothetical protein
MKKLFILLFLTFTFSLTCLHAGSIKTFTTSTDFSSFNLNEIDNVGASLKLKNKWISIAPKTWLLPTKRYSAGFSYSSIIGKAVLHGGLDTDGEPLGDFWVYDPFDNAWACYSPVSGLEARCEHKLVDIGSGKSLLFGGRDSEGAFPSDTWIYDFNDNSWTQKTFSVQPPGREYFGMCYNQQDEKVYLFGGAGSAEYYNDLWTYDVNTDSWSLVTIAGSSPIARFGHGMTYDSKNNRILVFGGKDGSWNLLNDLWIYYPETNIWQEPPLPAEHPGHRTNFGFVYLSTIERTLLFGGYGSGGISDETWLYDLNSNLWTTVLPEIIPPARESMQMIVGPNSIPYIFGGYVGGSEKALRDIWKYIVRSSGSFVSSDIFVQSDTSINWQILSAPGLTIPSATTCKFQIAHFENGSGWDDFRGIDGSINSFYEGMGPFAINNIHDNKSYLRVKGYFYSERPPRSPIMSELAITYNRSPNPPQIISPENNSRTNQLSSTFVWYKSTDDDNDSPLEYRIQVADNPDFTNPQIDSSFIQEIYPSTVTFTSGSNFYEGEWYWHVYANDIDNGPWTDSYTFTVDTHPPSAVENMSAQMSSYNGSIDLQWISPGDDGTIGTMANGNLIVHYTTSGVIVTEDDWANTEGERTGYYGSLAGTVFGTIVTGLSNGTTYYFAVKIQDQAGNMSPISVNNPSGFTNAIPEVTLNAPDGGETWLTAKEINWTYTDANPGDTATISLKASDDGGSNYDITIATELPNGTTYYMWNTREVSNGTNYKIKVIVTDYRKLSGEDVSDDAFTIENVNEAPDISILYPTGEQILSDIVKIQWKATDVNLADAHVFSIYLSSNAGVNYLLLAELSSPATHYLWDTTEYFNGLNYRLKIIVTDEGSLSDEDSSSDFSISNGNLPPNEFNLLLPYDGSKVSPLKIELTWEDKGDPNPEDESVIYTLYYSTSENFTVYTATNIASATYIFPSNTLKQYEIYYWRVIAADSFGAYRVCGKDFRFNVLDRSRAESYDGIVSVWIFEGLPENGYIFVDKISRQSYPQNPAVESAESDALSDRLIKTLPGDIYRVAVYDIDGEVIDVESIRVRITFSYSDTDRDGYYDQESIPVENLKIAHLNEIRQKWSLPYEKQILDKHNNKVTIEVDHLSLFSIVAADVPQELLSGIHIFPNPFVAGSQEAKIRYVLAQDSEVNIDIYTLLGDLVRSWHYPPGVELRSKGQVEGYTNEIIWKGRDGKERLVANGMYLCVISARGDTDSQKVIKNIGVVK